MLAYSDLKKGSRIILKDQPYEIMECAPMFKGRGHSVLQTKIKNMISGDSQNYTFHPSDSFEEPDIEERDLKFVFSNRGKYVFSPTNNPSQRFELEEKQIAGSSPFLKEGLKIEGLFFENKLVDISLPIKVELKVKEAPPALKGQSAAGGTKPAVLESGAKLNVPLFINPGDTVEINTQTGEYVRRA